MKNEDAGIGALVLFGIAFILGLLLGVYVTRADVIDNLERDGIWTRGDVRIVGEIEHKEFND